MSKKTVLILGGAILALRLFLSGWLGLGDDEAYYWEWSRNLEWSYFDHPGMIAWIIRMGTEVFGENSFGVRFFGIACNALSAVFLWKLAREMFDENVAWLATFLYLFAPIFTIGAILIVPDAPLATAWMGFSLVLWRLWSGAYRPQKRYWILAGVVLGLGLLSKYTMILLALSGVVLFLFSSRRRQLGSFGFLAAVLTAVALCLPILLWNQQYDWPSLKFHLQDRQTGGGGANFNRWAQYFVSQLVALGPALYLGVLATLGVAIKRSIRDQRWMFLALVSLPPLGIFTVQALFAEFKPHWPAPAYPLLFIGSAALWIESREWRSKSARFFRGATAAIVLFFIVLVNVIFHAAALYPVVPKLARVFAPSAPWDPKFDPTNDLFGWDKVAERIQDFRDESKASGAPEIFVSSSRYQLVAQLAFAMRDKNENVIRVIPNRDYYSFTQVDEMKKRIGMRSIFVTDHRFERDPRNDNVFESCSQLEPVEVYRGDELARKFNVWLCEGFKGI